MPIRKASMAMGSRMTYLLYMSESNVFVYILTCLDPACVYSFTALSLLTIASRRDPQM